MPSEKSASISDKWALRFDDRDDEELAARIWARQLAQREKALAQPFRNFPAAEQGADAADKPSTRPL